MRVYELSIGKVSRIVSQSKKLLGKRLLQNALYNSGSFLLISLIGFATLPYFVAELGVEKYGIYILVTSLFGYYGLFDLGLGQGLIKFVSEHSLDEKKVSLVSGIRSAFWFQLLLSIVVSSLLFIYSDDVSTVLNVGAEHHSATSAIIKISSLGFLFSSIAATFSSSLRGLQLYHVTAKIDAINNLLLNLVSLMLLYFSKADGLYLLILVNVISSGVVAALYFIVLRNRIVGLNLDIIIQFNLLKQFFRFSIHIFLSKISNLFANYVVKLLIGMYAGPSAVSYFSVPQKLLGAFGGILSNAASTLMPYVSTLKSEGRRGAIDNILVRTSFIFSAVTIPIALTISIYSKEILQLWLNESFAREAWLVLTLTCISATIGSFTTIPNQVVLGLGNSRLLGHFSILTVIAYLVFLPVLTKYYLLDGAAYGLLAASLLLVLYVIQKSTKTLGVSTLYYLKIVFLPHLFPLVMFLIINCLIVSFLEVMDLQKLFIGIMMAGLYYLFLWVNNKKEILEALNNNC